MRRRILLALVVAISASWGCGKSTTLNTAPLSDEQKRQIAADDDKLNDEESRGRGGKLTGKRR